MKQFYLNKFYRYGDLIYRVNKINKDNTTLICIYSGNLQEIGEYRLVWHKYASEYTEVSIKSFNCAYDIVLEKVKLDDLKPGDSFRFTDDAINAKRTITRSENYVFGTNFSAPGSTEVYPL